jgi:hypothetical protein
MSQPAAPTNAKRNLDQEKRNRYQEIIKTLI